jgi:hypothetical protein
MPESRSTDSAKADFFVRNLGTSMLSPILVQLNSNEIFRITSVGAVSFPLPTSNIQAGINKLSFNINKGSAFELLFPKVTTYTARDSAVKSYQFSIDKTEARLVTDGRANCKLLLKSADEDVTLDVVINGYSKSIFIGGSIYEEDICDNLVYGTNRVHMSSDESFDLDEITIKLY